MCSKFHALAIGMICSIASSNCKPAHVSVEDNSAVPTGTLYGKSLLAEICPNIEQITEAALHEQSQFFLDTLSHSERESFNLLAFPDGFSRFFNGTHFIESSVVLTYNSPRSGNNEVQGTIKFGYRPIEDESGRHPDCYTVEVYSIEVPQRQIEINSEKLSKFSKQLESGKVSKFKKNIASAKRRKNSGLLEVCTQSVDTGVDG